MKTFNYLKNNYIILIILISTILLILPKWILSFTFFDENIILRIINDVTDEFYFPIIKSFSDFNFSNSYSENVTDLKLISYPIIGLLVNSFFFKILGGFSFIFLELICVALFLWLFYSIFLQLNFLKLSSLACAVLLFILPSILVDLRALEIKPLTLLSYNFEYFFTTRFPRPAVSSLYFFSFIFLTIKFYKQDKDSIKNTLIITILMGLTLNAFFYLFFIELFLLIIIFSLKLKTYLFKFLLNNFKHFFYCLLILLFFLSVFQIQIFFSEPDQAKRLGLFYINADQKKILFEYLFNFFFGIEFLFLFFLNTFFLFLSKNKNINLFYYLFIASTISPVFFFSVLNKGVDYYHFFNWIVISGFLFPLISIIHYIDNKSLRHLKSYLYKSLIFLFIAGSLFYFNLNNYLDFKIKTNNDTLKRYEINEATNFISQNLLFNKKDINILNLNYELSIWLILNNYNNFSILPVTFWTPKTDHMIEEELFSSMKFLGLTKNDFYNLIKNEKGSWRYRNDFNYFYWGRKYLANSLVVFNNDESEFNKIEKIFIESNNLLSSHQIIIPKSEMSRLLNEFENYNKIISPDIVILDHEDNQKIDKFKNSDYCLIFNNNKFSIYSNKILNPGCLLTKN